MVCLSGLGRSRVCFGRKVTSLYIVQISKHGINSHVMNSLLLCYSMCSLKHYAQFIFEFYVMSMTILTRYATVVLL